MDWCLHSLEAEGDLTPWRERILFDVQTARESFSRRLGTSPVDILVQRLSGAVIPEIGMGGHAFRKGLLTLTLDPENQHFAACLEEGAFCRTLVHEVHHCMRMGAMGYDRTLGEALVSEGLAGQFTGWLFGTPPEPWECAVDKDALRAHRPTASMPSDPAYDHNAWFFGAGRTRPRWLGYTLGYDIARKWIAKAGAVDGDTWVSVPPETVLAVSGTPGAGEPVIHFHGTRERRED